MFKSLGALVGNTFTETLRQPVFAIIIGATLLIQIFGPSLTMFTIADDNKLLKDTALSTLLVAGLFLAVFAASTVVNGEIENKTVLTVISKKVRRSTFVIGKFLGVAAAVVLGEFLLCCAVLIIDRHGVMQTASEQHDWVVITLGSIALGLSLLISTAGNYFYGWRFSSTFVKIGTVLACAVVVACTIIAPEWQFNPAKNNLDWTLIGPMALIMLAALIITAIAITAATRVGLVMTLVTCVAFFLLGVVLPPWLEPIAQKAGTAGLIAQGVLALFPAFKMYVVANVLYQDITLPWAYLGQATLYALFYVAAVLLFGIVLFENREIG